MPSHKPIKYTHPCTQSASPLPIPFPSLPLTNLNLIKKTPILNLESLPNPRRMLHRILNQLPLFPQLQIDIVLRILALDMRHVNRDQDIRVLFLQPNQIQYYRCEIWRRVAGVGVPWWCLCRDERVRWCAFSVGGLVGHVMRKDERRNGKEHLRKFRKLGVGDRPYFDSVQV
jgi:hypothetical protein